MMSPQVFLIVLAVSLVAGLIVTAMINRGLDKDAASEGSVLRGPCAACGRERHVWQAQTHFKDQGWHERCVPPEIRRLPVRIALP